MNSVTRLQLDGLVRPGDVIAVEYLNPEDIDVIIKFAEKGKASHALCCLGGLDIVEALATANAVKESSLSDYLKGNCKLTVRCSIPDPTPGQAEKAVDFWLARVNDPYDWGMIVGMAPILICQRVIGFFSKKAGIWCAQNLPNFLASKKLNTCAEVATRGLREFSLVALYKYRVENVDPEILRTDPSLRTKIVLDGAVLVD